MKRKFGLTALFTIILLLCLAFSACLPSSGDGGDDADEPERKAIAVSVDKNTVPRNVYAGEVRLSVIMLNVTYDNGDTENVALASEYISVRSMSVLGEPGTHIIDVVYENCKCSFSIVLLDPSDVQYTLTVHGGAPVSVDGVEVSFPVTEDVFEAKYDRGTVVVIDWTEEEGKVFGHWKSEGKVIDNQRRTSVVMNANYEYVAFAEDFLYSATFVTYNPNVSIAQIQAKTIYSASEIASEMSMDGYVFMGWTTEEITREEALSGNVEEGFVEFPYTIEKDVTFYAVWTPTGFTYTTVSLQYAGKRVDGKQIVSYTGNLTELEIPSTSDGQDVIAISKDAFIDENAAKLTRITIPSTVIEIEEGSFRNCSSLQSFYVDASSRNFSAEKGALYMNDKSVLVAYPAGRVEAEYSIESTVTSICDYAFYNAVLGGVAMPSDVSKIGNYAFDSVHIDYVDFSALKREKIIGIGEEVFNDYLTAILVDESEENAYASLFTSERSKIISDATMLDSVYTAETENGVTVLFRLIVGEFFDVKSRTAEIIGISRTATEITVPYMLEGRNNEFIVSSIGAYAFRNCFSLKTVVLPSGLERVCDHAFDDTPWAENLENHAVIFNNTLYKYLGTDYVFVLDGSIKRIAEGAFAGNTNIEAVDITDNVALERVDAYAFDGCINFKSFAAGATGNALLIKPALKKIAAYAFRNTAIKGIETQNAAQGQGGSLSVVDDYAFAGNVYLERVNFGMTTLTEISTRAFFNCYALQEINVAENEEYVSYAGILYRKEGEGKHSLFLYPSGKTAGVFNPSKPDGNTEITVVSLGEYSLCYADIGALELEECVEATNVNALNLPSLVYVKFLAKTSLHDSSYRSVFSKTGATKFVFERELSEETILTFFGRDNELYSEMKTNDAPCEFYMLNGILYSVANGILSINGAERTSSYTEHVIPEVVVIDGITYTDKIVEKYAFYGYNLKKLTVNGVSEFERNALGGAFSLAELVINGEEIDDVPTIYEGSLGDNFNNGLKITVECDPTSDGSYFDKWQGIIDTFDYIDENGNQSIASADLIFGEPFIVLSYIDNDNVRRTASVQYGTVDGDALIAVNGKKDGYSVGMWTNYSGDGSYVNLIDGYVITYNAVFECEWIADEYELVFAVPEKVTLDFNAEYLYKDDDYSYYGASVEFGSDYDFSVIDEDAAAYVFSGWVIDNETKIAIKGTWSAVLNNGQAVLTPERNKKEYHIVYDSSDSSVIVDGTGKTVFYGENYTLSVPRKNGYEFVEWRMQAADGTSVKMTYASGASCTEWKISFADTVTFYPVWKPKTIQVSLMLGDGDLYAQMNAVYGSGDYKFPLNISEVPVELRDKYDEKIQFFAGWADFEGKNYADADGNALTQWDKYENAVLYAVWPEFIETKEQLVDAINENSGVSVVLLADVELTESIKGEYKGVFNGNNHTVTVRQNVPYAQEVYSGIFEVNGGTIKNTVVNAVIELGFTGDFAGKAYIGSVCGRNNGIIENVKVNVTAQISFGAISGSAYVGGIFGFGGGTVNGAVCSVNALSINVSSVIGELFVGCGAGVNYGTAEFSLEIHNFSVMLEGKPFGGEINTIGSVIGSNGFTDETTGAFEKGTVKGSCRLNAVIYAESYVYYEEATSSAANANSNGRWETEYADYYVYQGNKITSASEEFSSTATYYRATETSNDYFIFSSHKFGAGYGGNNGQLMFSTVIGSAN